MMKIVFIDQMKFAIRQVIIVSHPLIHAPQIKIALLDLVVKILDVQTYAHLFLVLTFKHV
jgi:hypothetical protein